MWLNETKTFWTYPRQEFAQSFYGTYFVVILDASHKEVIAVLVFHVLGHMVVVVVLDHTPTFCSRLRPNNFLRRGLPEMSLQLAMCGTKSIAIQPAYVKETLVMLRL